MKIIKILALLTLFLNTLNAQTQINRFFYELNYIPIEGQASKKEMMVLDIGENKSVFQGYLNVSQDSIITAAITKMRDLGEMDITKFGVKLGDFKYQIRKSYPISQVSYKEKLLNDVFEYDEPINFNWKLQEKYDQINTYKVQLATCEYGGRTWNAWFTKDLPFQDGPYKFYGLPGLILKVSDKDNIYSFVYAGNKKVEETPNSMSEVFMAGNINKVSKEKFNQIYKNFKEDPIGNLRPMLNNPDMANQKMPDGSTFTEFVAKQERAMKKDLNKIKNPIEKETKKP